MENFQKTIFWGLLVSILMCGAACVEVRNYDLYATQQQPVIQNDLCLYGCPLKNNRDTDNILVNHDILVLSSNKKTKFADWVAYKVVKENLGGHPKRIWKKDPQISEKYTLTPNDYKGASAKCGVDRGHQAPLASFGNSKWHITNYLSNITPQKSSLNRGAWMKLEHAVRILARQGKDVFVVTGTYYTGKPPCILPVQRVKNVMPSGYFKVVAVKSNSGVKIASFLFPQNVTIHEGFCKYQSNLKKIEETTNLRLFPSKKDLTFLSLFEDLGCMEQTRR